MAQTGTMTACGCPSPASHDTLIDKSHNAFKARSQVLGQCMLGFLCSLSSASSYTMR